MELKWHPVGMCFLIGFFSIGETLASDYGVKRKGTHLIGCLLPLVPLIPLLGCTSALPISLNK
jgi:hypothetical protein